MRRRTPVVSHLKLHLATTPIQNLQKVSNTHTICTKKKNSSLYKPSPLQHSRISKDKPAWFNYVLCGVQGIKEEGGLSGPFIGLNLAVSGNIPPSSGLSSSSALVCASALSMSHAHGLSLSLENLAEICARCERHIGTQGGGMDQAISFLATKGCCYTGSISSECYWCCFSVLLPSVFHKLVLIPPIYSYFLPLLPPFITISFSPCFFVIFLFMFLNNLYTFFFIHLSHFSSFHPSCEVRW